MKSTILSVTQLNTYIKSIIDGDMLLRSLYVVGEISNFTNHYRTGHFYLTLKDESCAARQPYFPYDAEIHAGERYEGYRQGQGFGF